MKPAIVFLCIALALPVSAQLQQGIALFEQGRYEEARKVLTPLQNDPEAVETLGRIALLQEDNERAIELLERAVKMRPTSGPYHFHLAEAYGAQAQKASI